MFCEKCGAEITGKEKFCPKCGGRIAVYNTEAAKAMPVGNAVSLEQQPKPQQTQPVNFSDVFSNNNVDLMSQVKMRKKKSHVKAIVATVISLIIVGALAVGAYFILPYFIGIKAEEYATVELISQDGVVYDDRITAEIKIDIDKIADDENIHDEDDVEDIIKYCSIGYEIERESDGFITESADNVLTVNNLKKDDVIRVRINWDANKSSVSRVKTREKNVGIHFLKEEKIIEFKVKDLIKQEKLEVEKSYEFDFFNITGGVKDGYYFYLSANKGTIPGTSYTYEFDYIKGLDIYDSDDELLGNVALEYTCSNSSSVYVNDKIPYTSDYDSFTVTLTKPNVKNVFFTETICNYKSK